MPQASTRSCFSGHDCDRGTETRGISGGGWPLVHVTETVGCLAGPLAGSPGICIFSSLRLVGGKPSDVRWDLRTPDLQALNEEGVGRGALHAPLANKHWPHSGTVVMLPREPGIPPLSQLSARQDWGCCPQAWKQEGISSIFTIMPDFSSTQAQLRSGR